MATTAKQYQQAASSFQCLANPVRLQILQALRDEDALSPVQLMEFVKPVVALGTISHHTRELKAEGLLVSAGTRPVRGAVQHFYRLSARGKELLELADQLL